LIRRHRSDEWPGLFGGAVLEDLGAPVELRLLQHADRETEGKRRQCPARHARLEEVQRLRDVHRVCLREVVGRPQMTQPIEQRSLRTEFSLGHGSSSERVSSECAPRSPVL